MHAFIVAIVFFLGYAIGIISAMYAIEKHLKWPYLLPVAFGPLVSAVVSFFTGHLFDPIAAIFLSAFSLVFGWLTVRFQIMKAKP